MLFEGVFGIAGVWACACCGRGFEVTVEAVDERASAGGNATPVELGTDIGEGGGGVGEMETLVIVAEWA